VKTHFSHPLPFGAELTTAGHTRFRLWAPAQSRVLLEIDGLAALPMRRDGDGVFTAEASCGAGATYRYRLESGVAVPDPASRAQVGDVHGKSIVVDPRHYHWQRPDWRGRPWEEAVIYEVHVGALGGFAGVARQLPALRDLGVTAIELMPIGAFPGQRNWGYDGVLPYAPASCYGSPDSLKALIDSAHRLDVMVFLDVVYNHFGPDGNYLHLYSPEFFRDDVQTPWGSAIDFRRDAVRDYFIHNALYWLMEYRFDGLRFDAVHAIDDATFLEELAARVRATVEPGRHVHLVLENEHNDSRLLVDDFTAQWNDDGHNALHVLLTGETDAYYANYAQQPAQLLARVLAEGFAYQGEPSPGHGGQPRGTPSGHLAPDAFVLFLQNHDQIGNRALGERLTLLADPAALAAAIAVQLLCPQIPLLFMGEDWGSTAPFLFFTDFHGALADAVRRGRRKEFAAFAAFANPSARERIPDPNADSTFARSIPDFVEAGTGEHAAYRQLYQRLLKLRHEYLVPRLKGTTSLGAEAVGAAAVTAAWQLGDGYRLRLAANFGDDACAITAVAGELLHESVAGAGASAASGRLTAKACSVFLEAA